MKFSMTCKLYIIKWHSFYEEYRIYKLYMPHNKLLLEYPISNRLRDDLQE